MFVAFDKENVFRFESATSFLEWYAKNNAEALEPSRMTVEGARDLLFIRAMLFNAVTLDQSLDDDAFVRAAADAGMFGIWSVDDLENESPM